MSIYTTTGAVTITCHKRTVPYLEQEVKELGFTIDESFVTGVKLKATVNECIKLNLNLRCASQVLYSLTAFKAVNADDVYNNLRCLSLGRTYCPSPATFPLPAM